MNLPANKPTAADVVESVIVKGDLGQLTPAERVSYYNEVCKSIGVNPLTRPLEFIKLQGRETLYAKRDCADQLRKINGISIAIVSAKDDDGMFVVHAKATDRTGREDEDYGVVALPETVRGEARANAILKAITKAKRRVTLSISGLGFLDETEVEDTQRATIRRPTYAANPMRQTESGDYAGQIEHMLEGANGNGNGHGHDQETGEVDDIGEKIKLCATVTAVKNYWRSLTKEQKDVWETEFSARLTELESAA